jgi:hypothetical protein
MASQERPVGNLLARNADAAMLRSLCFLPFRIWLEANLATRMEVLSHLFFIQNPPNLIITDVTPVLISHPRDFLDESPPRNVVEEKNGDLHGDDRYPNLAS